MADESPNQEKRKFVRFNLHAQGVIFFDNGDTYNGTIRDISVGGVFLELEKLISEDGLNQLVAAKFSVEIQGERQIIESECKIARITEDGVGLFFSEMDNASKTVFLKIMKEIRENFDR